MVSTYSRSDFFKLCIWFCIALLTLLFTYYSLLAEMSNLYVIFYLCSACSANGEASLDGLLISMLSFLNR